MVKKFLLSLFLMISLPTFAMEEPVIPQPGIDVELLLNTLNIKAPLTTEDLYKISLTATILAQQEEFKKVLGFFIEKVETLTDLFSQNKKLYEETEFFEKAEQALMYDISFKNIKNYHTVATIMRDRKLITKHRDFTPEDKFFTERYLRSSNSEIRVLGKLLKIKTLIDEVEPEVRTAYVVLGKFLRNFEMAYNFIPEKIRKSIEDLLKGTELASRIAPKWLTEKFMTPEKFATHLQGAQLIMKIYEESFSKANKLYKSAVSIIGRYPPILPHQYEYMTIGPSVEWKFFPPSLEDIVVPEVREAIEEPELPPIPEEPLIKPKEPKKKPIRKRPTPKPEKPIEEVAPEIPEEIEVEEVEPTYPELVSWFNENFKTTDGSSVSFVDDYQIIIEDPKNNAQVVLYRKSQDDKKIITPAMPYTDRVKQWFTDPQKALEDGSYTIKFKTQKKLDEMAARHNFAQMVDAFIDKEGVSETHIDEKKRKIPVKLLAGELRLRQPDGSVETVSGIFSYGRLPKANKYYHRYLHEKEYGQIAQEYYADAKWQVEFPVLS